VGAFTGGEGARQWPECASAHLWRSVGEGEEWGRGEGAGAAGHGWRMGRLEVGEESDSGPHLSVRR
jgi:hypothetical protein